MPVEALNEAGYNPRRMSEDDRQKLRRSIIEFGLVDPIIVNIRDGKNVIVGGNQRYAMAKELGYTSVPVVQVDLDDDHEKALNLALNKISGDWDRSLLSELLQDLMDSDLDIDLSGFTEEEINGILKDTEVFEPDDDLLDSLIEEEVEKKESEKTDVKIVIKAKKGEEQEKITALLDENGVAYEVK